MFRGTGTREVDDPAHRDVTEHAQVRTELVGLPVRRAGVDEQQAGGAADDAHADVERVVAALEHPVGDLRPRAHTRMLPAGVRGAGVDPAFAMAPAPLVAVMLCSLRRRGNVESCDSHEEHRDG